MAYTVYVLFSSKDEKLYVGCTSNLQDRMRRHMTGQVVTTKNRRPLELIRSEFFDSKADAFNRERFLKSLWGAREKKRMLQAYLKR